jgi:glycosyltransferase 2 family protein
MGLPPARPFLKATLMLGAATGLTGLHLAILGAHTGGDILFLVSAYALSTIFGLVFAVLPGAVGVRDGALLLILATRLPPAEAAALALLSRSLIVAGDVIGAALSALALRLPRPTLHLERSTL